MELDRTDLRILLALQQDGRRTVVELADTVGLSATPCARRVRQLETSGVIQGYSAVLDPMRVGLRVMAFVQVKLDKHTDENIEQFRKALDALDEVVSCHATTGEYDFVLQVMAPDLENLGNLVLKRLLHIPFVRDVHSSIVLQTFKRSSHLPLDHLEE
jgi:Lrp/AsnC family leucine-responsive transcriptional regulator